MARDILQMIKAITDRYLINSKLKEIPYIHSKARILAYVHLFTLLVVLFLYISTFFIGHVESVPLPWGGICIFTSLFYFRSKGNLIITGNVLAGIVIFTLLPSVPSTGGIYSDNLLWLILSPLIALLFCSRKSGIFWTIVLVLITIYFYFEELDNIDDGKEFTLIFNTEYYLISYLMLFVAVVCTVHIFEKGREEIIQLLAGKNRELEENRARLREQRDLLVQQKRELEGLSQELKNSNADLENFAHAASHDMKQPLRMIKSYLQLITRDKNINLEGPTTEYMDFVMQGADRLDQLINALLSLSQVGKEADNNTEVSLNDVMIFVKNNLSEVIKETNAVVHADNLPNVFASKSLIIQLFQNIIANGIKFQNKETLPVISVKAELKEDEVIIEIKDNGIGISEEYQQRVFNIFERLNTQSEYEGSGIGLHTCKKIMDSMGKKMWLTSEEGKGTSFYLALPLYNNVPDSDFPLEHNKIVF